MDRKKATDFPQELIDLFQLYQHGEISRQTFLDRAARFAAGGVTAAGLLAMLKPNYALAEQVPKDDKRIRAEYVTIPSPQGNGTVRAYLVRPASASATAKVPAVVVIHENRGLNPYIEDVARRLGTSGYISLAPDGLTTVGGYPGDEEKAVALFNTVDKTKMTEDFVTAANWLKARPDCTGKIGAIGFCFGGGIVNNLAVRLGSDLAAGAPFYGAQPNAEDTAKIKAPLMLHYADPTKDTGIGQRIPAFEQALKANNKTYQLFIYEGAQHGFHNDTTPRYDEQAAKLAWQRTLEFFNKNLRG